MSAPTPEDLRRAKNVFCTISNLSEDYECESLKISIIAAALARERGFTAKDMREAALWGWVRGREPERMVESQARRRWPDKEGA